MKIGIKYKSNSKQTLRDRDYKRDSLFFLRTVQNHFQLSKPDRGIFIFFLSLFFSCQQIILFRILLLGNHDPVFLFFVSGKYIFFYLFLTGYNVMDATMNIQKQTASIISANISATKISLFTELHSNFSLLLSYSKMNNDTYLGCYCVIRL